MRQDIKDNVLYYNEELGRIDVLLDGESNGGFHCGDIVDVFLDGKWVQTTIEFDGALKEWYLSGYSVELEGLMVKVNTN